MRISYKFEWQLIINIKTKCKWNNSETKIMKRNIFNRIEYKRLLQGALFLCVTPVAMSAEWVAEPSVSMSAAHDDNFRLAIATAEVSASSMTLRPRLKLSRRTEISDINVSGYIYSKRYDNSQFNSDALILDLGSNFRNSELSTLNLNVSISRRPTLTTELEDSGRFEELQRDRDRVNINPSWSYQLSSKSSLQVSYSGTDVDYNGSTTLVDYKNQQVTGTYSYQLSEKDSVRFSVYTTRYEPNNTDVSIISANDFSSGRPFEVENVPAINNTDTVGFSVGGSRNFSQTLQGSLYVGLRRSERTLNRDASEFEKANPVLTGLAGVITNGVVNQVTETTTTTLDLSLSKRFELTNVRLNVSNTLSPSSNGALNESTQVGMNIDREISPKLDLKGEFQFISNNSTNDALDRKYYSANFRAIWRFSRGLELSARYTYRQQKFDAAADSTDSNLISISLAYAWPRISVSR